MRKVLARVLASMCGSGYWRVLAVGYWRWVLAMGIGGWVLAVVLGGGAGPCFCCLGETWSGWAEVEVGGGFRDCC